MYSPSEHRTLCELFNYEYQRYSFHVTGARSVCLARTSYGQVSTSSPFHIGVALLECSLGVDMEASENRLNSFDLLEVDFFDDESIVVVLGLRTEDGKPKAGCKGRC